MSTAKEDVDLLTEVRRLEAQMTPYAPPAQQAKLRARLHTARQAYRDHLREAAGGVFLSGHGRW